MARQALIGSSDDLRTTRAALIERVEDRSKIRVHPGEFDDLPAGNEAYVDLVTEEDRARVAW